LKPLLETRPLPSSPTPMKKKEIGKKVNNVMLGVIIGGAIGSVVGMSVAPEEGKQTRKKIGDFAKNLLKKRRHKKIKRKSQKTQTFDGQLSENTEDFRKIPHE